MTFEEKLRQVAEVLRNALVVNAPKDTWNLALNAIRIVQDYGKIYIVIGGEIAPYAVYTNEPWINRKGQNPNEGWIQRTIQENLNVLKAIIGDKLTKEDIEKIKEMQTQNLDEQRLERIRNAKEARDKI